MVVVIDVDILMESDGLSDEMTEADELGDAGTDSDGVRERPAEGETVAEELVEGEEDAEAPPLSVMLPDGDGVLWLVSLLDGEDAADAVFDRVRDADCVDSTDGVKVVVGVSDDVIDVVGVTEEETGIGAATLTFAETVEGSTPASAAYAFCNKGGGVQCGMRAQESVRAIGNGRADCTSP